MKSVCSALLIFLFFCVGCASTSVETGSGQPAAQQKSKTVRTLPPYNGPKIVVAILPLGLSERAAKRYPHLLEKSVGMGIHNMVLESLFDTKRFRFVEENPEMVKDIMNRQWMSASGFVSQEEAIEYGKMLGAEKIIYGEVYNYAEGGEKVSGFAANQKFNITVGVQLACTDIETGEKVALGTADATAASYGEASQQAIADAIYSLVKRLGQ